MSCRSSHWQTLLWLGGAVLVAGCSAGVWGLRPEYPEVSYDFSLNPAFVEVDSLQPMLRWEAFPRLQDRELDRVGLLKQIRNVTYDLKIWRAEYNRPAEVVYTQEGLRETSHKLEHPLKPSTKYFWTIRARFDLDGHPRVTEWGLTKAPLHPGGISPLRSPLVPNPNHYRFKTPEVMEGKP